MFESSTTRWLSASIAVALIATGGSAWYEINVDRHDLEKRVSAITRGDPERGRELAQSKGCGGCHEIPGTQGAPTIEPQLARIQSSPAPESQPGSRRESTHLRWD